MLFKNKIMMAVGVFIVSLSACQIGESDSSKTSKTPVVKDAPVITAVAFYKSESVGSETESFQVNGDASDAVRFKVNIEDAESDATKLIISVKFTGEGSTAASYTYELPQQKFSKCFYFNTDVVKANGAAGSYELTFTAEDGAGNKSQKVTSTLTIDNKTADAANAAKTIDLSALKTFSISYDAVVVNQENSGEKTKKSILVDKGEYYIYSNDIILYKNDQNHQKLIERILESEKIQTNKITYAQSKFAQKGAKDWYVSTWPGNTVHYYFDTLCPLNDSEKQTVKAAIKILEATCTVRFIEEPDNIFVQRYKIYKGTDTSRGGSSTCGWSLFGGWYEFIANDLGIATHEIMHGIGMMHEHQRPDRDNYVTVTMDNILWYEQPQFWVLYGANTYTEYDYNSIMHYGAYAFTCNSGATIQRNTEDGNKYNLGSSTLSEKDKATLRTLYSGPQSWYWKDCYHNCWQPYTETWTRIEWRWAHLWHYHYGWVYRVLWTYPYFDCGSWSWRTGQQWGWSYDCQGYYKDCGSHGAAHPEGWEPYSVPYQVTLWGLRWMSGCGQKFWPHQEWIY